MFNPLGPFTRPHPAIWRMVFGEWLITFYLVYLSAVLLTLTVLFWSLFRSQCPLLPLSGIPNLSELGSGENTIVLARPQSALRHSGGRCHGKWYDTWSDNILRVLNVLHSGWEKKQPKSENEMNSQRCLRCFAAATTKNISYVQNKDFVSCLNKALISLLTEPIHAIFK